MPNGRTFATSRCRLSFWAGFRLFGQLGVFRQSPTMANGTRWGFALAGTSESEAVWQLSFGDANRPHAVSANYPSPRPSPARGEGEDGCMTRWRRVWGRYSTLVVRRIAGIVVCRSPVPAMFTIRRCGIGFISYGNCRVKSRCGARALRGRESEGKVFGAKAWFLRGLRASIFPGTPRGMFFPFCTCRKSAAPIVRPCEDRKPWFSRAKASRIGACHPRGMIF